MISTNRTVSGNRKIGRKIPTIDDAFVLVSVGGSLVSVKTTRLNVEAGAAQVLPKSGLIRWESVLLQPFGHSNATNVKRLWTNTAQRCPA
jgi:hypothetical protein